MHRGATLLEFVASLTIFGLLIVGMQSSVGVAVKSIPNANSPVTVQSQAHHALDTLSTDLQSAVDITEFTGRSIGFTVPDRNGDGRCEHLRYAWSGASGAPLTRQLNRGTATALIPSLRNFALTAATESETIVYPALCVEDATESLLIDRSQLMQPLEHDITSSLAIGQRIALDLPPNCYAWRPTRIQFPARYAALLGVATVQLRTSSLSYAPGNDILQQQFLSWLTLSSNYTWQSFTFNDVDPLPSGGSLSLLLHRYYGSRSATLLSSSSGKGLLRSSSNGLAWELQDSRGLVCQVYGKQWRSSGTRSLTINKYAAIEVALQTSTSLPALNASIAILNKPAILANQWHVDFAADPTRDPTLADANGDGQNDWKLGRSGILAPTSLTTNGWQTGGDQLISTQDWRFHTPAIIEFTAQSHSATDEGAVVTASLLQSSSQCVPLTLRIKKMPDGTQSVLVQARTSTQTSTLLNLAQQGNHPLQVRLILDPAINALSVFVGEVAYGTFGLSSFTSSQAGQRLTLGASGSSALIRSFRVRCL